MEILHADTPEEALAHAWDALDANEIYREDYVFLCQRSRTPREMMTRLALYKEARKQELALEANKILLYNQSVQTQNHTKLMAESQKNVLKQATWACCFIISFALLCSFFPATEAYQGFGYWGSVLALCAFIVAAFYIGNKLDKK